MKELLRTNDLVLVSWLTLLLRGEDIEMFVFDGAMSVLEGSAGAIPRRVMVDADDYDHARRIVIEAGGAVYLD